MFATQEADRKLFAELDAIDRHNAEIDARRELHAMSYPHACYGGDYGPIRYDEEGNSV